MKTIVPHLWFDKEAKEAAMFYIDVFENSMFSYSTILKETPSGDAELVSFQLAGQDFVAISAGPYVRFNPSISLMVACQSELEVNTLWEYLSKGGRELMPLGEYPFSKRYAWVEDRFGLSWQLMLNSSGMVGQKITPNLLFSNNICGKAEEAIRFYVDVFEASKFGTISKYEEGEAHIAKAKVKYGAFQILDTSFSAMDNGYEADFHFNEALSFVVYCKDQKEIDHYWDKLSAVPEAEECGWLKDKFGVSWQIIPEIMRDVLHNGTSEQLDRVTKAFLKMKKFDIEALEKATQGR